MRDDAAHRLALSLAHDLTRPETESVTRPATGAGEDSFSRPERRGRPDWLGANGPGGLVLHHICPTCGSLEHGVPYTLVAGRRVALSISRAPGAVAAAASIPAGVTGAAAIPDGVTRAASIPDGVTGAATIPAGVTHAATTPAGVAKTISGIPPTFATPTFEPHTAAGGQDVRATPAPTPCNSISIGIDLERADAAGFDGFADVALHPAEPVPADASEATRLWVRKEAVLKALGTGLRLDPRLVRLAGGLDSAGVNSSSAKPRVLAWPDPRPPSIVDLCDLDAPAGYVAALAVIGGRGAAYTQVAIRLDTSSGV